MKCMHLYIYLLRYWVIAIQLCSRQLVADRRRRAQADGSDLQRVVFAGNVVTADSSAQCSAVPATRSPRPPARLGGGAGPAVPDHVAGGPLADAVSVAVDRPLARSAVLRLCESDRPVAQSVAGRGVPPSPPLSRRRGGDVASDEGRRSVRRLRRQTATTTAATPGRRGRRPDAARPTVADRHPAPQPRPHQFSAPLLFAVHLPALVSRHRRPRPGPVFRPADGQSQSVEFSASRCSTEALPSAGCGRADACPSSDREEASSASPERVVRDAAVWNVASRRSHFEHLDRTSSQPVVVRLAEERRRKMRRRRRQ